MKTQQARARIQVPSHRFEAQNLAPEAASAKEYCLDCANRVKGLMQVRSERYFSGSSQRVGLPRQDASMTLVRYRADIGYEGMAYMYW